MRTQKSSATPLKSSWKVISRPTKRCRRRLSGSLDRFRLIDGVFGTRTGTLVPYQVKFRSQRAYLTYTEIAPFLGLTERATDRIVFTNSNELAADVKNRDATRTVRGIDFDDLTEDDFRAISCWLREQPVTIPKVGPRPDQIEALKRISETLITSDRAHVVMAVEPARR
jgi:predicted helicase